MSEDFSFRTKFLQEQMDTCLARNWSIDSASLFKYWSQDAHLEYRVDQSLEGINVRS